MSLSRAPESDDNDSAQWVIPPFWHKLNSFFLFPLQGTPLVYAIVLLASVRWLLETGVTAMWGAFTFPTAAFASALLTVGGAWEVTGMVVLAVALGIVPAIAWNVLKLWPGNRLAVKSNAAEA